MGGYKIQYIKLGIALPNQKVVGWESGKTRVCVCDT